MPERILLDVDDLHVGYRGHRGRTVPAVRGVTFQLRRGEVLGLVGESGSGKSSVCAALTRTLPEGAHLKAARLDFGGTGLVDLPEEGMRRLRATRIGLVPQRPMTSLSPATPVLRQLRWYGGGEDLTPLLKQVGLRTVLDRPRDYPHRFSGGQLQRLLIVLAALARRPDLLIADEPTTTLDATVQAQVLRLLLDLRDRLDLGILYVTHDLAVVAQVCDRVAVMYGGRLVETGTIQQIFGEPRHPYTKALLAALPGRTRPGERLGAIPGSAVGAAHRPGCPFAPRCPVVLEHCREEAPHPIVTSEATVSCHRAEEPA
ncbi:ABC transporter ATP-binding protein [Actinomadura sp. BRA 177]|uniref:ABC transporter ATP-binding protein n=1 Tax=Actinomadura sp. BRA 177 TaxID=2745202 RepID=UPI0015960A61|nr:ABC transporter ATP-binding protein [Actinomadura sp. BRA 177]NVI92782.1 ABC transporter ATP-binding protein [Actinomadura sp. BRA 177]